MPETPKLARPLDRKTAVISLTKTLINSAAFADRYTKGWAFTCNALLELLVSSPVPATTDDFIAEQDVEDTTFGIGFTQLTTIKKPARDPWPEVTNVKTWVSETLNTANSRSKGKIAAFAKERLLPEAQQSLSMYMQV